MEPLNLFRAHPGSIRERFDAARYVPESRVSEWVGMLGVEQRPVAHEDAQDFMAEFESHSDRFSAEAERQLQGFIDNDLPGRVLPSPPLSRAELVKRSSAFPRRHEAAASFDELLDANEDGRLSAADHTGLARLTSDQRRTAALELVRISRMVARRGFRVDEADLGRTPLQALAAMEEAGAIDDAWRNEVYHAMVDVLQYETALFPALPRAWRVDPEFLVELAERVPELFPQFAVAMRNEPSVAEAAIRNDVTNLRWTRIPHTDRRIVKAMQLARVLERVDSRETWQNIRDALHYSSLLGSPDQLRDLARLLVARKRPDLLSLIPPNVELEPAIDEIVQRDVAPFREHDIRVLQRIPPQRREAILEHRRDLEGRADPRPRLIVIATRLDHNGAFDGVLHKLPRQLWESHRVIYAETSDAEDSSDLPDRAAFDFILDAAPTAESTVILGGHSTPHAMKLASGSLNSGEIDTRDTWLFDERYSEGLESIRSFILIGCSTGRGEGERKNVANLVSAAAPSAEVWAPTEDGNISYYRADGTRIIPSFLVPQYRVTGIAGADAYAALP